MKSELKKDLISAWNEVEEVVTDFNDFDKDELHWNRESMKKRLIRALDILGEHFTDDDVTDNLKI
jgi:hypothetical protein